MSSVGRQVDFVNDRQCSLCGVWKSSEDFFRCQARPGGLAKHCKSCNAERCRERRQYGNRKKWGLGIFRRCPICDLWKMRQEDFYHSKEDGKQGICKDCTKRKRKEHYAENKDEILAGEKKARRLARQEMIAAYGGRCQCCGESHWEFLTIDHINGGGCEHRRRVGGSNREIYRELKRRGWPRDEYRLLCYNCNCCLGSLGYCPHDKDINI